MGEETLSKCHNALGAEFNIICPSGLCYTKLNTLKINFCQPAKATGTTPIHIEPIGRHPSVLEHAGTRHKSPKDRPSSPQSSRRHVSLGERWGNPHVRRQFRKLETKFNKKVIISMPGRD